MYRGAVVQLHSVTYWPNFRFLQRSNTLVYGLSVIKTCAKQSLGSLLNFTNIGVLGLHGNTLYQKARLSKIPFYILQGALYHFKRS